MNDENEFLILKKIKKMKMKKDYFELFMVKFKSKSI